MLYKLKYLTLISIIIMLNACSTLSSYNMNKDISLIMASNELKGDDLLNVSIQLFEPGKLPGDEEDRRGLSNEIRKAEARFIPIHLKYTLQRTGFWGNVRVLPGDNEGSEVIIKGKIINSDGESIELNVQAYDASNKKWFDNNYEETIDINSQQQMETEIEIKDRFQNLYNQIANDLIKYRQKLQTAEVKKIKEIAKMRFASSMAPNTFSSYIKQKKNGINRLIKLPADNDSMMNRVNSIQSRDEMLVDTINNYYNIYYSDMWESYDNWRRFRSEELDAIREIEYKATTQKILGIAAIIGAIALGASHNSNVVDSTNGLRTIMIAGGSYAVYEGFKTSKESEINKEVMEELGMSFSVEVEPYVVDVNGKTMELTGSADQQYDKWRRLLKTIYANETSF